MPIADALEIDPATLIDTIPVMLTINGQSALAFRRALDDVARFADESAST